MEPIHLRMMLRIISLTITLLFLLIRLAWKLNTLHRIKVPSGKPAETLSQKSALSLRIRAEKKHVILQTEYQFTKLGNVYGRIKTPVLFGDDNQILNLDISTIPVTWGPQEPSSPYESCKINNCAYKSTSGYYSKHDKPVIGEKTWGNKTNCSGQQSRWADGEIVEDVVTIEDTHVNLQFLAATSWANNTQPLFGLGLNFGDTFGVKDTQEGKDREYGYLSVLFDQSRIGAKVCSFYNIVDTNLAGEIVFGGVNPNRFYGELDVYDPPAPQDNGFPDGKDRAYLMDFPTVRIGDITNNTTMVLHSPNSSANDYMPFIRLNSLLSHLTLPLPIVDDFHSAMTEFEQYVLELSFRKATISIPFQDFVQAVPGNLDLCPIFLFGAPAAHDSSLGGAFFKAAYIVLEPDANRVAIAAAVRDPSAPSDAATKEISDGGIQRQTFNDNRSPKIYPNFLPTPKSLEKLLPYLAK
ncbi:hypothetical protein TWF970_007321 [Orbilia oligospora]|uniref:Peptidase A1 domain-containing protein n=1 Tax=Orbilia oligospora TaxID=2813651 RepID=A0A7C8VLU4_ORBOL|nr:hypothetical protein TWF970_007321 [Orbilia oligospora]